MSTRLCVAASDRATPAARRPAALYWLALGTFAIGTEGFMIAALLPTIAADIRVSVAEAGLLVSIFALAYATSSPVLTALTGRVDRRQLLLGSMSLFAVFNMAAALAHSFLALAAARVLLAFAAGLFTPNANALAGALVPAEQRGRAIAIVNGGLTAAIALGVPLGALVGERLGWRMTFVGVGVLSAIAAAGLARGLQRGVGASMVSASLRDRVRAVRNPRVARSLAVTTALWGMSSWAFFPAQQTRFIELVGVTSAPVALSLNASFMYLGFSLGAALGGFSLLHVGPRNLGFVGAVCDLAALTLLLVNQARDARPQSERVVSASPDATPNAALE